MVAANALRYSKSDKRVFLGIAVLSFIVIGFLFWLIYFRSEPTSAPEWTRLLPALNAFLNSTSAVLVVGGVFAIINGKRRLHITCMLMAVAVSAVFLVSYVIYHHFQGNTLFLGQTKQKRVLVGKTEQNHVFKKVWIWSNNKSNF